MSVTSATWLAGAPDIVVLAYVESVIVTREEKDAGTREAFIHDLEKVTQIALERDNKLDVMAARAALVEAND